MIIELDDGSTIAAIDMTAENALQAHGYDPETVDYSVQE